MIPFRAVTDVEPGSTQLALGCNLMQRAPAYKKQLDVIEFLCLRCQIHEGLSICFAFLRQHEVEIKHSHECHSAYGHFLRKQIGLITDKIFETSVVAA